MTTEATPRWFTSSYSNNGGQCVEVAANLVPTHGVVPVRDSKNPDGPTLTLSVHAFTALIELAKQGGTA
ncbi:DUF397 domain-containing protein [Streptomyces sp. NPDC048111]|uniref:DUF397 domain-containing protein n=1 Tax=Streptomyces sp. NPDC048111 TaxID=3365500 RepID=UPI00371F875A